MKETLARFLHRKKQLSARWQWICLLIGVLVILGGVMFVSLWTSPSFVYFGLRDPLLLLLNGLPILLLVLLLFFITDRAILSVMLGGTVFALLSVVNAEKIRLLQDPLVPGDLVLAKELVGISEHFTPQILAMYFAILFGLFLLIVIAAIFFGPCGMNKKWRLLGIFVTVALGAVLGSTVYANQALYDRFQVEGNIYFQVNQFDSKGAVYSFCHSFYSMQVQQPEGYNKTEVASWEEAETTVEAQQTPHIIMIMGEAFSDLSENEHLDFSAYRDPLENWKALQQSGQAVSGHIVVPNFGGGTSDTEFDVLTGLSTRFIEGSSNSYSLIRSNKDALGWRLKELGYDTLAVHPGYSWFYNRANVYPALGFDSFIHLESFQGEEKYRGGYIADKYAVDCILDEWQTQVETEENPLFTFCVTIQNHGPYDEKYNEVEQTFDTDVALTEKEETLLNSYFMGIIDADEELGRLTETLNESDEPVVVVYFGDHLPGFSNGTEFFDLLDYDIDPNGTMEEMMGVYETPYLIWQNDAAQAQMDLCSRAEEIGLSDGSIISSNFLGAAVMDLMGFGEISPLIAYDNEVRQVLPVVTTGLCMRADGTFTEELTEEEQEMVNRLSQWTYYKMFDEDF